MHFLYISLVFVGYFFLIPISYFWLWDTEKKLSQTFKNNGRKTGTINSLAFQEIHI